MDEKAHSHTTAGDKPVGETNAVPLNYAGGVYTCPMHPEVRQIKPGACRICGMALELESPVAGEEDTSALADMTRRFWVSAALTLPLFVYAMSDLIPGRPFDDVFPPAWEQWIQFALATPVVLWGGRPFFVRGVQSIGTMISTCSRSLLWALA